MGESATWFVTELSPWAALEHDRRVYNVGPGVELGWTPYTHRVTRNSVSQWATVGEVEFERTLKARHLKVVEWSPWHNGVRFARLVEVA